MPKDFTARISPTSERAETWRQVFGTETVYLKSPVVSVVGLPGEHTTRYYDLDLTRLDSEQRKRLVEHLSDKFDMPPTMISELLNTFDFCPILAEDVTVTV